MRHQPLLAVLLTGFAMTFGQASVARAQHLSAVRPIDGYACSKLKVTEREAMDARGGVPIRTEPNAGAPIGTLAPSVLITKQPLHVVNGFVEVLQLTGQPGWIERSRVAPFDPLARCVPSIMSNGRPGIG